MRRGWPAEGQTVGGGPEKGQSRHPAVQGPAVLFPLTLAILTPPSQQLTDSPDTSLVCDKSVLALST